VPDAERARSAAERAADHAAIDRLSDGLLPALIAKLGATGLGELEIREGDWHVRLRRPADAAVAAGASGGRSKRRDRAGDGSADRADVRGERPAGRGPSPLEGTTSRDASRHVATSPAVGIYRPRTDLGAGTRIRAGDRLGAVDMLGVAQEVVAPADGIIGASLAEAGDAVEYGQQLLVIEFAPAHSSTNGSGS
jgi:biotin carboxyl carrier protein